MVASLAAMQPCHALRRSAPGWVVRWLAVASLATAAAFSAAQTPAASDAQPAPVEAAPSPDPPPGPKVDIAVVLPLDAPNYARAAEAVRAGFAAGADAAGGRTSYVIIPHGEDGVLEAFESARRSGATVIVGPLVRDDVRTIAQVYPELPWTLALNQAEDVASGPAQMFTFSLTVESDARAIARRLRDDAAQYVAIVGGDTPLMKRFAVAFTAEWLQGGGTLPHSVPFDPAPQILTQLKRDFEKKIPDAALLAVDGNDASLAKPYVGTVPAFASGLVFDRKSAMALHDLDGLTVVEIPWLVTPNAPEFANFARKEFASASLERLYALGLDAFRIAQAMKGGPPDRFVLDGATGHIVLGEGRQFSREGLLAIYRDGQLVPLDGRR